MDKFKRIVLKLLLYTLKYHVDYKIIVNTALLLAIITY